MGRLFLFDGKGGEVRNQWLEKNVDLSMLAERIRPFFHDTNFETSVEKTQEGYVVRAVSKIPNLRLGINVEILGRPNDFIVEFSAGGKDRFFSRSMIAGYLTMFFGGGYLISREAKKRETLDVLEKAFWAHTQMQVADLVGSAAYKESRSKT